MDPFTVKVGETEWTIQEVTETKGRGQGKVYLGPDLVTVKPEDLLNAMIASWGANAVAQKFVLPKFKEFNRNISREAMVEQKDEQGKPHFVIEDPDETRKQFEKLFAELNARGESYRALTGRLKELQAALAEALPGMSSPEGQAKFMDIAKQLAEVQQAIAEKKAKDEEEEEEEESPAPRSPVPA